MSSRGRLVAVGAGALVLAGIAVCVAGGGLAMWRLDTLRGPAPPVSAESVHFGRQPIPLGTSADFGGQWRYELEWEGDRLAAWAQVTPAGTVVSRYDVTYADDGGWTAVETTAFGVPGYTLGVGADARLRSVERTGLVSWNGCTDLALAFDASGRTAERRCLDSAGHVIIDKDGCAVRRNTWDESGLLASVACFDDLGRPADFAWGGHEERYERDAAGRLTRTTYLNAAGDPVPSQPNGCARVALVRHDNGEVAQWWCQDAQGLATTVQGEAYAGQVSTYDADGCRIEVHWLDASRAPATRGPVHRMTYAVDERCVTTGIRNQDAAGEVVAPGPSLAGVDRVYDDAGNLVQNTCYGAGMQPARCMMPWTVGPDAASVTRMAYDDRGRVLSLAAFDAAGNPVRQSSSLAHESRLAYDDRGLITSVSTWDAEGRPATTNGEVSLTEYRYDELGSLTATILRDAAGDKVIASFGCAQIITSYDEEHLIAYKECLAPDGSLAEVGRGMSDGVIRWAEGAALVEVWREEGIVVENVFFDADEQEIHSVDCTDNQVPCLR